MARRNKIDIIENLLTILSNGKKIKPTRLMYKSNLSHIQMKKYFGELIEKGFVEKEIIGKNGMGFVWINNHGRKFLEKIKEMREFEDVFGL